MPDSEDEFALLNEVDILVTKIKARPEIHFDAETDADIRKRIRANESLEVRLTKWQSRLTNLQKLLNAGSSGLSGGPPAASVVATSCAPAVSTGRRKRTCSPLRRPTLCYRKNDDDKPPEMAAIHVEFVEMCAKRLRVQPTATGKELVDEWNEHHAGGWGPSPSAGAKAGRGRSTGRADHFFDNHYVTMQELYGIVDGTLPHPVPASTGLVARTRRSSTRILGAKRRRPSRSPSPSPGQDTDANAASPPPEEARRASGRFLGQTRPQLVPTGATARACALPRGERLWHEFEFSRADSRGRTTHANGQIGAARTGGGGGGAPAGAAEPLSAAACGGKRM